MCLEFYKITQLRLIIAHGYRVIIFNYGDICKSGSRADSRKDYIWCYRILRFWHDMVLIYIDNKAIEDTRPTQVTKQIHVLLYSHFQNPYDRKCETTK